MYRKKDEDNFDEAPFGKLERAAVLQDTRMFTQKTIQARQSCIVLTKILYLIYQGHTFSVKEATDVFFAMTRLFQSKDATLRRLVYLAIKELAYADHVLMVTSSLTKDISGKEDNYRAAAIRALCTITDSSNVQGIERYVKQCIVDRNAAVASAAIISALHMSEENIDVVKRWSNEIQEAVNCRSVMVQYHALGLLYKIKQRDRLAIMKLVGTSTRGGNVSIRSSYAMVLLIRYVAKILNETNDPQERRQFMEYLEHCLRDSNDMVMYEAARTICRLEHVGDRELGIAISVLQLFLVSPSASTRFAAVKTLNQVAMKHPLAVATCNLDMETLISDPNKTIGVMAITTLLKTGSENSVDRLIQQIPPLMDGIGDDFKIVVTRAIGELALKFPQQQHVMMNFLAGILRDQGGYEYKLSIVNTLVQITSYLPDAKESGLLHLCEFIEDCDYSSLCARVLRMLGEECPLMPSPSRYIKYIHNRVILENAEVRAAAVSALAKFGFKCEELAPAITVLLTRCKFDVDDEVRDRATLYVDMLTKDKLTGEKLMCGSGGLPFSITSLERTLSDYIKNEDFNQSFNIKTVSLETNVGNRSSQGKPKRGSMDLSSMNKKAPTATMQDTYSSELAKIPQFAAYGPVFKSSKPVMLTESETEYVVKCIKHVFNGYIVLQFGITNTISEFTLQNLVVLVEGESEWVQDSVIPLETLGYDEEMSTYVSFKLPDDPFVHGGVFANTLKFICVEADCDEGYDDEYQIEELEITTADHMLPVSVPNFSGAWGELNEDEEIVEVFELSSMGSINEAVETVTNLLGMFPCERSDVVPENKNSHTLLLAGFFRGNHKVLVRARLAFQLSSGVTMQLAVRSTDADTAQVIASVIG